MKTTSHRDHDNRRTTVECRFDDAEMLTPRTQEGIVNEMIHEIGVRVADELWETLRPAVHEAVRKHFEDS